MYENDVGDAMMNEYSYHNPHYIMLNLLRNLKFDLETCLAALLTKNNMC